MKLTDGQLDALRNLSRKKAGLNVGWIVIADARELTELGFAARAPSGWEITGAGAALLAGQHLDAEPAPAGLLLAGAWPLKAPGRGEGEGPALRGH
jgi:hypothetical protein